MRSFLRYFFVILMCFYAPWAAANEDAGLYDLPPKNAFFVRVVNTQQSPIDDLTMNGHTIPAINSHSVTDYYGLTGKMLRLKSASIDYQINIQEGNFVTINPVQSDEKNDISVIHDEKIKDLTKAVIGLYNASALKSVSLKTADGTVDILGPLNHGEAKSRSINPVSLDYLIEADGKKLPLKLSPLQLENRQSDTIFVFSDTDVKVIRSDIATLP